MHHVPQRVEVALPGARTSKMAPYRPCKSLQSPRHFRLQLFRELILPARISPDGCSPLPVIIHHWRRKTLLRPLNTAIPSAGILSRLCLDAFPLEYAN